MMSCPTCHLHRIAGPPLIVDVFCDPTCKTRLVLSTSRQLARLIYRMRSWVLEVNSSLIHGLDGHFGVTVVSVAMMTPSMSGLARIAGSPGTHLPCKPL